jgi:aspartyl/asparaginyl beta-hydroxylase (cupin superfamily)
MDKGNDEVIRLQSLYYKSRYLLGKTAIFVYEGFLALFIKRSIFYPEEDFGWAKKISEEHLVIKQEFEALFNQMQKKLDVTDLSEEQNKVVKQDFWYFIPLFFYGYRIEKYCAQTPQTTRLLESIPYMTTAIFSTIKPGADIASHRGAYRAFLRYHLGIKVPKNFNDCKIYFNNGDITYAWKNGEGVVFDDTFQHYVKNNTHEYRTVLYVDFIRPMPRPIRRMTFVLFRAIQKSPYVQNVLTKLRLRENDHKFKKINYSL